MNIKKCLFIFCLAQLCDLHNVAHSKEIDIDFSKQDSALFKDIPISEDGEISVKNQVLGPINFEKPTPLESFEIDKKSKQLFLAMFLKKEGGNNYSGDIFKMGSNEYKKNGYSLGLQYGIFSVKTGANKPNWRHEIDKKIQRVLNDHLFHHVAFSLDTESNQLNFYLDGNLVLSSNEGAVQLEDKIEFMSFKGAEANGFYLDNLQIFEHLPSLEKIKLLSTKSGSIPKKSGAQSSQAADYSSRRIAQNLKPTGEFYPHLISKNWICIRADFTPFLRSAFLKECGPFLSELSQKSIPDWSLQFNYDFGYNEIINAYRPQIVEQMKNANSFKISVNGQNMPIELVSYWIEAINDTAIVDQAGKQRRLRASDVNHFAFIKLKEPLTDGKTYAISACGTDLTLEVNWNSSTSEALKVNQVGYSANAGEKYAYLGRWLGPNNKLDVLPFNNQPFYIYDHTNNTKVFEGVSKLRQMDSVHANGFPILGEDVLELDFSKFKSPGKYRIVLEGIGCSFPFLIGNNAIGEVFYKNMRGLFHQRCGIEKNIKFTPWASDTCHVNTFSANFVSDDRLYFKGDSFKDGSGNTVRIKQFDMIKENATEEKCVGVKGGWHDAADYDRRSYHFKTVRDLLSVYLMKPQCFLDSQLNIPESGNGIPDIVDEAIWGMDVWLKAQNPEGSVATWIEADSHPKISNPSLDTQRYYLAKAGRWSSLEYASHAALLSIASSNLTDKSLANTYKESAIKAFNYALEIKHQLILTWPTKVSNVTQNVTFTEPIELPIQNFSSCCASLYVLTGDQRYFDLLMSRKQELLSTLHNDIEQNPFSHLIFGLYPNKFPEFHELYKKTIFSIADRSVKFMDSNAYRHNHYPANHGYFGYVGWGNAIPLNSARVLSVAHHLTHKSIYLDKIFILNDLQYGANPLGKSMTTGLGVIQPIAPLHLASYSDNIDSPVPGITPYFLSGGVSYMGKKIVYGLFLESRNDHGFQSLNKSFVSDTADFEAHSKMINGVIPFWRRNCQIGGLEVPQNEFTIWETIAPSAAMSAYLLDENWRPSSELLNEKPRTMDFKVFGLP